jgi:hypothetical protein
MQVTDLRETYGIYGKLTGFYGIYGENAIGHAMRCNPFTGKCNVLQSQAIVYGIYGKIILRKLSQDFPKSGKVFATVYFSRKHVYGISGNAIGMTTIHIASTLRKDCKLPCLTGFTGFYGVFTGNLQDFYGTS